MPADFTYQDPDGGPDRSREQLEALGRIELRLSRVAAAATGRPNIRNAQPELWQRLMDLKSLRDDVAHAKVDQAYGIDDDTVFGRLFKADFRGMIDDIGTVAIHYLD